MCLQAVAAELGSRTAEQVKHYFRDNLRVLRKGAWTPEEDEALIKVSMGIIA